MPFLNRRSAGVEGQTHALQPVVQLPDPPAQGSKVRVRLAGNKQGKQRRAGLRDVFERGSLLPLRQAERNAQALLSLQAGLLLRSRVPESGVEEAQEDLRAAAATERRCCEGQRCSCRSGLAGGAGVGGADGGDDGGAAGCHLFEHPETLLHSALLFGTIRNGLQGPFALGRPTDGAARRNPRQNGALPGPGSSNMRPRHQFRYSREGRGCREAVREGTRRRSSARILLSRVQCVPWSRAASR